MGYYKVFHKYYFCFWCVEMFATNNLRSEDQFLCSICLDVFTDPGTKSCGHNLCKNCIIEHWDISGRCKCPLYHDMFYTRAPLQVNTFICEVVAQFRLEAQRKAYSSRATSC